MKYFLSLVLIIFISLQSSAFAKTLSDNEISKLVEHFLVEENDIPNTKIDVTTKDRIVFLSGKVDTKLQATRIIELASGVKSVVDVNTDNLEINSSKEFLSDAFITAKAKGKIKYLSLNGAISEGHNLHVETTNAVVHIFGNVKNKNDIETIRDSINDMIDVASVKVNIGCR